MSGEKNGFTMLNIENIIPHIPSVNINATADFFINLFEFKINVKTDYFIELKNKKFSIGLLKAEKLKNEQSIYIQVTDIDNLWCTLKDKIVLYRHKELFTQEYGMKEFHVIIPETSTLLIVGEPEHG